MYLHSKDFPSTCNRNLSFVASDPNLNPHWPRCEKCTNWVDKNKYIHFKNTVKEENREKLLEIMIVSYGFMSVHLNFKQITPRRQVNFVHFLENKIEVYIN